MKQSMYSITALNDLKPQHASILKQGAGTLLLPSLRSKKDGTKQIIQPFRSQINRKLLFLF